MKTRTTSAARGAKANGAKAAEPARSAAPAAGPRIYNLFPLLIGRVSAWRAELPRVAELGFDWIYVNPFHETGGSEALAAPAFAVRATLVVRVFMGPPSERQSAKRRTVPRPANVPVRL